MSEQNKALMSRIIEELWNKKNPAVIGQLYALDGINAKIGKFDP